MKNLFLAFMFLLMPTLALAGTPCANKINSITDLSPQVKQEMILKCEQSTAVPGQQTIDTMDQWSQISLRFAKAVGVAAKEFGVAVDEFLGTDAGKLTAVFIGYKIMGADILYILFGTGAFIIVSILCSAFRKLHNTSFQVVEEDGKSVQVERKQSWDDMSEGSNFCILVSYIVQIAFLAIFIGNI